jgi:GNAT superfamily N-acetyltransferase
MVVLEIRAAAPDDLPTILALIRALADYEKLADEAVASAAQLGAALFAPHPRVFCDLAEWRDGSGATHSAGFALWFYNFSTFRGQHGLYLEDLFVRPAFRGRGVGAGLLRHLARRCVEENLGRFEWAVLDWNTPARGFYESLGARPLKEWIVHRLSDGALIELAAATADAVEPSRGVP